MEPESRPASVIEWHALFAYLAIGVAIILALSFAVDLLAKRFGFTELVETGRRRDLGFIIALMIALPITHFIAKLFGLAPKRVKSQ